MKTRTNYEGIKVGKLTVLKKVPAPSHIERKGPTYYLCLCECGKEITIGSGNITKYISDEESSIGRLHSCGCGRMITETGMKIGKLTLLEKVLIHTDNLPRRKGSNGAKKRRNKVHYNCRCECGNEIIRSKKQLVTRATEKYEKSCGCEITRQRLSNVKRYNGIPIKYLASIKDGAKNRELEYSVSDEYVSNLYHKQNKKCALTGKNISFYCDSKNGITNASLDRIDNDKGYIEGNLQWVDTNINMLKLSWGVDEFKRMCDEVSKFNSVRGTNSKKGVKKQNTKIKSDDNMFFQF